MIDLKLDYPFFIKINNKVFIRQRMLPAHDHVLYLCREHQQEVKIRWSKFYHHFEIQGASRNGEMHPYMIWVEVLRGTNIYMEERYIPQYLTLCQAEKMEGIIHQTLLEVWNRK